MFEDSTFESSNRIKKRNPWVVATFTLNIAILAAAIIYPLINYEALPKAAMTTCWSRRRLRRRLHPRRRRRCIRSS